MSMEGSVCGHAATRAPAASLTVANRPDPTSTAAGAAVTAGAAALTKTERGRLKKLRRRSALGDDGTSLSSSGGSRTGIVTTADYVELSDLLSRSSCAGGNTTNTDKALKLDLGLGPSVLVSNRPGYVEEDYSNPDRWQQTSGADHRDIILSLLFHDGTSSGSSDPSNAGGGSKNGKRKRGDRGIGKDGSSSAARQSLPSLPSWARLHNPACANGLVVVEFSLESSSLEACLMPSKRILKASSTGGTANDTIHKLLSPDGCHGRRAVPFATRLFQGDKPRHVTDVLLYADVSSQEQQRSVTVADFNDENATKHDMQSILESFVLKRKDRRKERYPCRVLEKKRPPKKKRHKMTEAELSEEQREGDRKLAQQTVEEKIAERLPAFLTNTATDEHSKKCGQLFEGAFSREEAIDLVRKLEVNVLGQDEYTAGEVFISTFISSRSQDPTPSIFAMDCEMVETSAGRELARVTLIRFEPTEQDADGYTVLLDLLVKPVRPVLDYKTRYSGITAAMLEPVTTRIEQVQVALASIVGVNDIMIGHSLENDLRVLCLVHEKVVDTALLFRTENGARKHSLKHLSSVLLKRKIQAGCGSLGHCSEEDAAAALLLALNRARIGDSFRLYDRPRRKNTIEEVSMLRRNDMLNATIPSDEVSAGASRPICETEAPIVVLGPDEWLKEHFISQRSSAHALRCENMSSATSGALLAWLSSKKRRANLVWAHLTVDEKDVNMAQMRVDEVMVSLFFL